MNLLDLIVKAGRSRLGARTGLIHDGETIPIYENFCFCLSLFRQKTVDAITEGKALLSRLLAFQTADGNFPAYLHDYPSCFDFRLRLKVAPILIQLLRLGTLGSMRPQVETALQAAIKEDSNWESRLCACRGEPIAPIDTAKLTAAEWTDWLITAQLAGQSHFEMPYDPSLQILFGNETQEGSEPCPYPVEWLLAEAPFSARLLKDHRNLLLAAPLFPITSSFVGAPSPYPKYWQGKTLHSLVVPSLTFDLSQEAQFGKSDLFEAACYTDISKETEIFVSGKKATSFHLQEPVVISTPQKKFQLVFHLMQGSGDFCGHIFRANRPSQVLKDKAYDWQIGIRTLRRSAAAQIGLEITIL